MHKRIISDKDFDQLQMFQAYLAYRDNSADLREVWRRLGDKYKMEHGENRST